MSYNRNVTALVDTGFWYALLDERDQYFHQAQEKVELLLTLRYIIPWPILYETLCTRFIANPLVMQKFKPFLKSPNAIFMEDVNYKENALDATLSESGRGKVSRSLVDNVLRAIIDDTNVRVQCLFTFNRRDFADVCAIRRVEMI